MGGVTGENRLQRSPGYGAGEEVTQVVGPAESYVDHSALRSVLHCVLPARLTAYPKDSFVCAWEISGPCFHNSAQSLNLWIAKRLGRKCSESVLIELFTCNVDEATFIGVGTCNVDEATFNGVGTV